MKEKLRVFLASALNGGVCRLQTSAVLHSENEV